MAIVKTPVHGYTGPVGDDYFVDGVCKVPDHKLVYYKRHGYIIEAEELSGQEGTEAEALGIPGAKAKKAELVAYATKLGINTDGLDVAGLREAIEAHTEH
ncbi:hypothetical protein [Corynebacterium diphtheriae]|uniref:hypothetical protein n=1 Tax=Corynebacterium diphtheriae TaxID=1717 RepID=UPI00092CAE1C|nr:hypothetical protein [Corynebacterium diphtheriae]APM36588.1 hypothetical protein BS112_08970 [Corynebacterium diphtheriae]OJH90313.1 hypothetical protein BKD76_01470 [Corynebacterium diphtheriae]OJH91487.1 hypothetical protein BKD79_01470 [Corynebacterium diphtheriae]OJI00213.1 hypothetical protein BKD73_01465 [Corynebacterium diphtheriae]OSQ01053.1 hypothetical protein B1A63_00100 [Corynebacterium diphtheriae]